MNASMGNRVLSSREASSHVGLSEMTLRRYRTEGTGPRFVRLGERRIGYRIADLDAWLESRAS
jgi:predicted DNA-binding transcriptional regulator AlpA